MSHAPRKSNSVARAVTRAHWWGGTGAHYALEFRKGPVADAHFKNGMHEDTFDQKEARAARLTLRISGSFVKAVTLAVSLEESIP